MTDIAVEVRGVSKQYEIGEKHKVYKTLRDSLAGALRSSFRRNGDCAKRDMYMRLAFAIAPHLDPKILIVDEVLSVGDAEFQKQCLGKIGDVARGGRTVVFVSHQMAQIRRLCQRVFWIDAGQIRMDASSNEVASAYESALARGSRDNKEVGRSISQTRFLNWEIAGQHGDNRHLLNNLEPVTIRITLEVERPIAKALHGIVLYNNEQQLIWSEAPQKLAFAAGEYTLDHTFPMLPLRPGYYTWAVTLYGDDSPVDSWSCQPEMSVATENYQTPCDQWMGVLKLPSNFVARIEPTPSAQPVKNLQREEHVMKRNLAVDKPDEGQAPPHVL